MKEEFQSLKLVKGQDPDIYVTKLEKLQIQINNQFKYNISETYLTIQIIYRRGKYYEFTINHLTNNLYADQMTLYKNKELLNNKHKREKCCNKEVIEEKYMLTKI